MDTKDLEALITTWMSGWAQARTYSPKRDGRAFVVPRHDKEELVERLIVSPSTEEFKDHSQRLSPGDRLTVITQDLAAAMAEAERYGLINVRNNETLMVTAVQAHDVEPPLPPGDSVEYTVKDHGNGVTEAQVTVNGTLASQGFVSVVKDVAVFDKIRTEENFKRRGLGSFVMRVLTHEALDADIETGLLLASPEGRLLYQHLGWDEVAEVRSFTPQEAISA